MLPAGGGGGRRNVTVTIEGGYTTLMSSLKVPMCDIFELLDLCGKIENGKYQLQSSK
jgi:hypothetical protein